MSTPTGVLKELQEFSEFVGSSGPESLKAALAEALEDCGQESQLLSLGSLASEASAAATKTAEKKIL